MRKTKKVEKTMEEKEIEIDLKKLLDALLSRLWVIVAVTVMVGVFAFLFSKFAMTPLYAAKSTVYINSNATFVSKDISSSEITASSQMATVFAEMLKSNLIMNEVIKKTELAYNAEQLASMVSASAVDDTPVMKITVVSPYPKEAVVIANAILEVAPEKIPDLMDGGSVKIIDTPVEPQSPSSPNVAKNTIIGLLIGFILSAGLVVLMELLDSRIKDEEQLRSMLDLPVLGVIPEITVTEE